MKQEQIDLLEKTNLGTSPTGHKDFDNKGFLFLKNLIEVTDLVETVPLERGQVHFEKNKVTNFVPVDEQVPGSLSRYNHPKFSNIQKEIQGKIEKIIGKELYPTYYYDRFYFTGHELTNHLDRDACEISVTLNISSNVGEKNWPFYVKSVDGEKSKIIMNQGDAVLYKGCERPHWRNKLESKYTGVSKFIRKVVKKRDDTYYHQIFFHYVLANGSRIHFAYDK